MTPRVKWTGRTDFAEAAEALKIPTDQVMAVTLRDDGRLTVMWSDGVDDDAPICASVLARDRQGVPVVVANRMLGQTVGQLFAELRSRLEDSGA